MTNALVDLSGVSTDFLVEELERRYPDTRALYDKAVGGGGVVDATAMVDEMRVLAFETVPSLANELCEQLRSTRELRAHIGNLERSLENAVAWISRGERAEGDPSDG